MTDTDNHTEQEIVDFLETNSLALGHIATTLAQMFEVLCFVSYIKHYQNCGYKLVPKNLYNNSFRFKHSTKGYPWNFSFFVAMKDDKEIFEVRHNLTVAGKWRTGTSYDALFALDVAVIEVNSVPSSEQNGKRRYHVENRALITFGEAKRMKPYPTLLAHFIGLVHEVSPQFLDNKDIIPKFFSEEHPNPTLFTNSEFTFGTKNVMETFNNRRFRVNVLEKVNRTFLSQIARNLSR